MSASRWVDEFTQHPFRQSWATLKDQVSSADVEDKTATASVAELARLKRVVVFLDEAISTVDPELTPVGIWGSFQQQTDAAVTQLQSFLNNKNIGHIRNANANADNLISFVRPFVGDIDAAQASAKSAETSASTLGETFDIFASKAAVIQQELETNRQASATALADINEKKARIDQFSSELFIDSDQATSLQKQMHDLLDKAAANSKAINELHVALAVGTPQNQSTQAIVTAAAAEVVSTRDKTTSLLDSTQAEVRQLSAFYEKIFGKKDEATNKLEGGLEQELDARTEQLRQVENAQKLKHAALVSQIETLLPGATSAGLATAYKDLKDQFATPIDRYTRVFYGALAALFVGALAIVFKHASIYPTASIEFTDVPGWDGILKALAYKAPFVIPIVWLALFASTRRSQYERLQQEYAHKEALASSYESYKRQIEDLKRESEGLQHELIAKAIEAISYNASKTLDGKHGDKMPVHHLLEKIGLDDMNKLIDVLKKLTESASKEKK